MKRGLGGEKEKRRRVREEERRRVSCRTCNRVRRNCDVKVGGGAI